MAGRKITKDVEYFFNDIVDLNWSQNRVGEFKKKVIEQLWTIDFWPMGRSVIEAIVKKAKGNNLYHYFAWKTVDGRTGLVSVFDPRRSLFIRGDRLECGSHPAD